MFLPLSLSLSTLMENRIDAPIRQDDRVLFLESFEGKKNRIGQILAP